MTDFALPPARLMVTQITVVTGMSVRVGMACCWSAGPDDQPAAADIAILALRAL